MTNEDLGYNHFFEENRAKLGLGDFSVARIVSESRGAYRVKNASGEYRAQITGKHIFTASAREDYPAVGDWVAITELPSDQAVIRAVLPRLTMIKRKCGDRSRNGHKDQTQIIATNIDVAFIIESVDRDYNLNRFERYFALAKDGGVRPVIILNKVDLLTAEELDNRLAQLENRFPEVEIILASVVSGDGLNDLKKYIVNGRTYCFLGSSGVGKSSLINKLLGKDSIKTRDVSSSSGRGKHTTTVRQMYFLEIGGIVIDNPGIREVGLALTKQGLEISFDQIAKMAKECRFVDCTHTHEPGCRILEAVKNQELDEEKYLNYLRLKKEADYSDLSDNEKREKKRQFGKFVAKAKKQLKEFE